MINSDLITVYKRNTDLYNLHKRLKKKISVD